MPGINAKQRGPLVCARCGAELAGADNAQGVCAQGLADASAHGVDLSTPYSNARMNPSFEDWELDQNVRQLQARLGSWRRTDSPPRQPASGEKSRRRVRVDASHARVTRPHRSPVRGPASRSSAFAWAVIVVGLLTVGYGAALVCWSHFAGRGDLWTQGLPILITGQAGLLLGLVLQVERLWQSSRHAARQLERVDAQLRQLQRTTKLLGVTEDPSARNFYTHMAEEASPQLLLSDLKGQLDLLAMSISKRGA